MMVVSDNAWWSIICTPLPGPQVRAQLEDVLYEAGCGGIWDQALGLGREGGAVENLDSTQLTAYFPAELMSSLTVLVDQLREQQLVSGSPRIQMVADEDWLDGWRKNFTLTPLTEKTLVLPSWQELPAAETRLALKIYPGQGFGTGTHETTRLAAIALEAQLEEKTLLPVSVLDVGTGSGILAILAALRGAGRVLALDIDDEALANARENCAHNQVCTLVSLENRPLAQIEEKFSLIVANIIAPVLVQLAPDLYRLLQPGGSLILSGILLEQGSHVQQVYIGLGLQVKPTASLGEWTGFVCVKGEA
ncbi:MAG: 50S ribosomal protein L11 methyltransferase [Deltaproteobacteria bacterium]|nr:50S ribosomal protein L11 methyltransferase [Deltaproteobacteria bacterium]